MLLTPTPLASSDQVDILVDEPDSVEFGADVVFELFIHDKTVMLVNAELDDTIGPILQTLHLFHKCNRYTLNSKKLALLSQSSSIFSSTHTTAQLKPLHQAL
ncbi:MAG: hypothetical protein WAW61_19805 [Methylococcaceae bacterium]